MRYLVTGANRGIGRELVRQLVARGDEVIATVRKPDAALELGDVEVVRCDVVEPAAVTALAAAVGDRSIDVLINNAGIWPDDGQTLGGLDFDALAETFAVNALGPLRVTEALLPALRRGRGRKVVHLSSGMASIAGNTSGGWYGYRMAKAALNMAARSLARDLAGDAIWSAVLDPGWVQTDMGGSHAPTAVVDSVRGLLAQIDRLDQFTTGEFLHWQGGTTDW
jgi:NAD(P)-dependent dehydrogenase (short-subunit alcohol dehydrogenase family)